MMQAKNDGLGKVKPNAEFGYFSLLLADLHTNTFLISNLLVHSPQINQPRFYLRNPLTSKEWRPALNLQRFGTRSRRAYEISYGANTFPSRAKTLNSTTGR
jgi:hypothetical protein